MRRRAQALVLPRSVPSYQGWKIHLQRRLRCGASRRNAGWSFQAGQCLLTTRSKTDGRKPRFARLLAPFNANVRAQGTDSEANFDLFVGSRIFVRIGAATTSYCEGFGSIASGNYGAFANGSRAPSKRDRYARVRVGPQDARPGQGRFQWRWF